MLCTVIISGNSRRHRLKFFRIITADCRISVFIRSIDELIQDILSCRLKHTILIGTKLFTIFFCCVIFKHFLCHARRFLLTVAAFNKADIRRSGFIPKRLLDLIPVRRTWLRLCLRLCLLHIQLIMGSCLF